MGSGHRAPNGHRDYHGLFAARDVTSHEETGFLAGLLPLGSMNSTPGGGHWVRFATPQRRDLGQDVDFVLTDRDR
jgi:hypothetical protein